MNNSIYKLKFAKINKNISVCNFQLKFAKSNKLEQTLRKF
jgi:hypothetical protein